MLQRGIGVTQRFVGPETISKSEMIAPEGAIHRGKVQVIRPWISPPEELTSRNALLSAMHVVGPCESIDVVGYGRTCWITGENVQNGLGRQTGNGGASCMLQQYDESGRCEGFLKSIRFRYKQARPCRIVGHQSDNAALEPECHAAGSAC